MQNYRAVHSASAELLVLNVLGLIFAIINSTGWIFPMHHHAYAYVAFMNHVAGRPEIWGISALSGNT